MQSTRHFPALWRRCVQCPGETPTCPECPSGQSCLLQAESCDTCASATCQQVDSVPGEASEDGKSSTPAIAGGVAGGVLFIIIVTFLVWWFFIRNRRQEWDEQAWSETDQSIEGVEKRDQSGLNRDARESTRSIASIASTVRTRASNVIQIAYIPGVTNRSPTHPPGYLAPPVPPIPAAAATDSEQEGRSLMPDGKRNSTRSEIDARQSLSPSLVRSSTATSFYPGNAELMARPAQQALRGKAAVVTVNKSGADTPPINGTPTDLASPSTSSSAKGMISSPIVARNVTARPIQVTRSNSGKQSSLPTLANVQAVAANKQVNAQAGSGEDQTKAQSTGKAEGTADSTTRIVSSTNSTRHRSAADDTIEEIPAIKQSQFTDSSSSTSSISELSVPRPPRLQLEAPLASRFSFSPPSTAGPLTGRKHQKSGSISSMIEEATNRAAREPSHGGLGSISETRGHNSSHPSGDGPRSESQGHGRSDSASLSGPFSDANEVWEGGSRSGPG